MSSCAVFNPKKSAYKKAGRNWERIQEIAKKYPELLDTFKIIKRDTIRTTEVKDSLVFLVSADTARIDSALRKVVHDTVSIEKVRNKIIYLSQPKFYKDTTYNISLHSETDTVQVPIRLKIRSAAGKTSVEIEAEAGALPDKDTTTEVKFTAPEENFYNNRWFWYFCLLAFLSVILLYAFARK